MITTTLIEHPWLTTVGFLVLLVVGPVVGVLVLPRRRLAAALAALSLVPVLALTLSPTSAEPNRFCEVAWSLPTPGRVELVANVVLFVPLALLLGAAVGRPLVGLLGGSALSVAVELFQAVVPALGRSCSTSDWLSNTIGAAVGTALLLLSLALLRHRSLPRSGSEGT